MISLNVMEKLTHNRELIDTAKLLCNNDSNLQYRLDIEHPSKPRAKRSLLNQSMVFFCNNTLHRKLKVKKVPCVVKKKSRSLRVLKLIHNKPPMPNIKKGGTLYECVLR